MKRSELLNNPVFQKAMPTSCLFVVKIMDENKPIVGIGELKRDFSYRKELGFGTGYPIISKEEMEKTLRSMKCKGVKNWNPNLVFRYSDSTLDPGSCEVVQTMDHNLVLRPYWTDTNGSRVYFDNYQM